MKDIVIITSGRILAMIISMVSIRVFTTLLSPYEVGRLNIVLASCSWFGLILISPVGTYINRKIIEWNKQGLAHKGVIYFLKYLSLIAIFAFVFIWSMKNVFGFSIDISDKWLIFLIVGSILFTSGNASVVSYLNLLGHREWFVLFTILTLCFSLGISSALVLLFGKNAEHWLLGQLTGQFLLLLGAFFILNNKFRKSKNYYTGIVDLKVNDIFNFAWPLSLGVLFYWIHTQGFKFVYEKVSSVESLGLFSVGFGIGSALVFAFDTAFNQFYHPIFYNEIANSSEKQRTMAWNKYMSVYIPTLLVFAIFIMTNGTLLSKILTGQRFHLAGNAILWGALCEGLRALGAVFSMVSHAQLDMKPTILPSVLGAVIALLGIIIFVPLNPFAGAGLALVLGWFFNLAILYRNMKNLLPISIPFKRILYSLLLSFPFLFISLFIKIKGNGLIFSNYLIISICLTYFIFVQFVLSRKNISIPVNVDILDVFENRINEIYLKFHKLW